MSYLDRVVDDEYCTLILETTDDGEVHAHLTIYQWSAAIYKMLLSTWCDVLSVLNKRGVAVVHATAPTEVDEESLQTLRFQLMFGFVPVAKHKIEGTDRECYRSEVKTAHGN